jgi:hypothetical protein
MSSKPSKKPMVKVRRYTLATIGVVATIGGVAGNLGSIIDLFDKFFAGGSKPSVSAKAEPSVNIAGTWQTQGEVRYAWGDKYTETFKLKLDGNEVRGTASFLGHDRAVLEGEMVGDKIVFITRTRQSLSSSNEERVIEHKYRGTVSENEMKIEMHSTGGFSDTLPVEFVVKRVSKP